MFGLFITHIYLGIFCSAQVNSATEALSNSGFLQVFADVTAVHMQQEPCDNNSCSAIIPKGMASCSDALQSNDSSAFMFCICSELSYFIMFCFTLNKARIFLPPENY